MNIDRFNRDDESYILYLLESQKRVSNAELCKALSLSTSSVRKKLAKMEEKGLLIRTHGGAASIDADRDETMIKKSRVNIAQKKAIALAASQFLVSGETIALGGGSTIAELAPYLLKMKRTIVLTDSTITATLIIPNRNLEVHINSGIVRGRTGCVVGPSSDILFTQYTIDKAFISCDSFSLEQGAGSENILVGKVERNIIKCAKSSYFLCDSTKLNQNSLYSFAGLHEVTALITDEEANPDYIEMLRKEGLTVIVAPVLRSNRRSSGLIEKFQL